MFDVAQLTFVHTAISLIALGLGWPAIRSLFNPPRTALWSNLFLAMAFLTSVTGFLFPFTVVTPAFMTGIVALAVLLGMLLLRGHARVYALGIVASTYLLAFVTVVQLFLKVPALQPLGGPTNPTPLFGGVQLALFLLFAIIGFKAVRLQR